ncbi:MAG: (2Fe-2S)-binding protein [Gammaproteobacteria bacterium]|nr:(2Fe-2S)-binding protein [Gammaproteobacteria bacterium]
MYVCVCNRVTDHEIRDAAQQGIGSMDELCAQLQVASCCGRCRDCAHRVLHEALAERWQPRASAALG